MSILLPMILATCAPAPAQLSTAAAEPQLESIERRLGAMGTSLRVSVEAPDRATALAASEAAVRAIEGCEQRLSTWRDDSELAQLNRAPVGVPFELSTELTDELAGARHWWRETGGAFDPAVGALVEAWGLRNGGRTPTADELERGRVPAGFGALVLERPSLEGAALEATATRRDARLVVEEGGFGKGAGLDAAHRALRDAGAVRGVVDLGGQLIVFGDPGQEAFHFGVADPDERDRMVLQLSIDAGSIATSGNSERAIVVDGEDPTRIGHLLDPRTARPCDDFGSLTVWVRTGSARTGSARTGSARTGSARTGSARTGSVRTGTDRSGLAADCLSTGLYVMGPEKALAWAEEHDGVEVLALVRGAREEDGLVARATSGLDGRIQVLAQGVRAQAVKDDEDAVSVEYEQG